MNLTKLPLIDIQKRPTALEPFRKYIDHPKKLWKSDSDY